VSPFIQVYVVSEPGFPNSLICSHYHVSWIYNLGA